jgi:23S rRNA (cytosine1962-C5)-methyltransferase
MATVHLARGRGARIATGHPWVYKTEVERIAGPVAPGDIVAVVDSRGAFLGRGYINPRSQILVRLLTTRDEPVDAGLIRRRVRAAWAYRRRLYGDPAACRVIFGEADFLPGCVVDKFNDLLVIQSLALGIEQWQPVIVETLIEELRPRGIYERNDVPVRELEGLEQRSGPLWGACDPTVFWIEENGLQMRVDVAQGQKTGYFLDQRENRAAIRPYAAGARVLDCFSNVGGFALNAVAGGASAVLAVDSSPEALAALAENAARNGMRAAVQVEEGNAFDALRRLDAAGARFDVVVLDPPAFAKNRAALPGATRGYKEINLRALRMIEDGGFLITCSCSYHMTPDLFRAAVVAAAGDAHRRLRLVEERGAARDHPVLVGYDESHYLKCLIYEVRS